MTTLRRVVALAASLILATSAAAQSLVLGSGPDQKCFESAEARRPTKAAFEACNAALDSILLADEDRAATYVNRSVLYLARAEPKAALADTRAALDLEPGMAPALINRSSALYMLRRNAEAKAAADAALKTATGREVQLALFNRAMAREALGEKSAAYSDLKQAVALDPTFKEAETELARFHIVH